MALAASRGLVVAQRYRLERRVGAGGMGEVWSATHLGTLKTVALKFLKDDEGDRDTRRRFVREARAASAVKHPNVVQYHDIVELEGGAPVLVMDLLEGESLGNRLRRVGALSLAETAGVLDPVVSAVGTAHAAGIIHRDLKPDNIFLVRLADGKRDVCVLDFGIAKLPTSGDLSASSVITETGDMLGTPYYMAPEQAFGQRDIDHRADIWALGIILYECLAGQRPVRGSNVGQILKCILVDGIPSLAAAVPGLPIDVTEMVRRMLLQDRGQRPSDLRQVREVLARYSGEQTLSFGEAQPVSQQVQLPDALAPTTPAGRAVVTPQGAAGTDPLAPTQAEPVRPRRRRSRLVPLSLAGAVLAAGVAALWRPLFVPLAAPPVIADLAAARAVEAAPAVVPSPAAVEPARAVEPAPAVEPPHAAVENSAKSHRPKKPPVVPPKPIEEQRLPGGVPEKPLF